MAVTIKVVSNTGYVEDNITVSITKGTLPSNSQIQIFAKISEQYFLDLYNISISETSKTFKISSAALDSLYGETPNTANVKLIFVILKNGSSISNQITKTMYIKPDLPTFDGNPGYKTVDSSAFSGNNFRIVNGLSKLRFVNISGTAKKHATIKYFKVNNTLINYNTIIEHPDWLLDLSQTSIEPYLTVGLVDSRGFETNTKIATISRFIYSYQVPKITEMTVERDVASETTTLNVKGYYSEGYQVNKNPLTSGYEYVENVEDATTETGTTSLTITKTPTSTYQDFLSILEEYNNHHYQNPSSTDNQYYLSSSWTTYGIDQLFETAISYNNKYTQEYLENDYDSTHGYYYCTSGGYNNNWNKFWEDTLKEIYKRMYGDNVYGTNIVGDEDGGNYQFEIEATIQGDIVGGFSIDKTFNITSWILDSIKATTSNKRIERTEFLPTAIPAIDVYKDKVALHGLYDETITDSDIQLWGNVFLNSLPLLYVESSANNEMVFTMFGKIGVEFGTTTITSGSSATSGKYGGQTSLTFTNTYKYNPVTIPFWRGSYVNQIDVYALTGNKTSVTIGCHMDTANSTRTVGYIVIGELDN